MLEPGGRAGAARTLAAAPGEQRGLIDQVGQVGAGEARGGGRDAGDADVVRQGQGAPRDVHAQDLLPPGAVRPLHCQNHNPTVSQAGALAAGKPCGT